MSLGVSGEIPFIERTGFELYGMGTPTYTMAIAHRLIHEDGHGLVRALAQSYNTTNKLDISY